MSMISCDLRFGRTEEQKRRLADGLLRIVCEVTGETKRDIFLVIREGNSVNFVENGKHLPDYVAGAANDIHVVSKLD